MIFKKKYNKHGAEFSEKLTEKNFESHPLCKAISFNLPAKVSLKSGFGRIYNQRYGNCTTCAVLACDAYYNHDPLKNWLPSATFTYYVQRVDIDKRNPKIDHGSSVATALKAVKEYGVCNSKVWQNRKPFYKKPSAEAYADGLKGKEITENYQVTSLDDIKKAIYLKYPVVVASYWCDDDRTNKKGVMRMPTEKEIALAKTQSGHAYVIVGYDDNLQCFEIRNSWGKSFGVKGYAYMPYKLFEKIVWYNACYAIVK